MNKFLKLTSLKGTPIYLRASAINMVTEDKDGTVICYGNDMCYQVTEYIDDVLRLLGGYFSLKVVEASTSEAEEKQI